MLTDDLISSGLEYWFIRRDRCCQSRCLRHELSVIGADISNQGLEWSCTPSQPRATLGRVPPSCSCCGRIRSTGTRWSRFRSTHHGMYVPICFRLRAAVWVFDDTDDSLKIYSGNLLAGLTARRISSAGRRCERILRTNIEERSTFADAILWFFLDSWRRLTRILESMFVLFVSLSWY